MPVADSARVITIVVRLSLETEQPRRAVAINRGQTDRGA